MALGTLSVIASFALGIGTAGDLHTIEHSGATENTVFDIEDAIAILEVAQGYREATLAELKADPNGNGVLTVDDALRILRTLASR